MSGARDTKKILADCLVRMMEHKVFEQISVTALCRECGVNRKSFYYHYRDKYDVINWIFDTGYGEILQGDPYMTGRMKLICGLRCLYGGRSFYRKAMAITGQNSFRDHFREIVHMAVDEEVGGELPLEAGTAHLQQLATDLIADSLTAAIRRWIADPDPLPPEEFTEVLRTCAKYISRELDLQ